MDSTQALNFTFIDDTTIDERYKVATLVTEEKEFQILLGSNSVGRLEDCDVILNNQAISSRHAVIEVGDYDNHTIYDLGSTNRTKINKRVLKSGVHYFIEDGSILEFGNISATYKYAPKEALNVPVEEKEEFSDNIVPPSQTSETSDDYIVQETPPGEDKEACSDSVFLLSPDPFLASQKKDDDKVTDQDDCNPKVKKKLFNDNRQNNLNETNNESDSFQLMISSTNNSENSITNKLPLNDVADTLKTEPVKNCKESLVNHDNNVNIDNSSGLQVPEKKIEVTDQLSEALNQTDQNLASEKDNINHSTMDNNIFVTHELLPKKGGNKKKFCKQPTFSTPLEKHRVSLLPIDIDISPMVPNSVNEVSAVEEKLSNCKSPIKKPTDDMTDSLNEVNQLGINAILVDSDKSGTLIAADQVACLDLCESSQNESNHYDPPSENPTQAAPMPVPDDNNDGLENPKSNELDGERNINDNPKAVEPSPELVFGDGDNLDEYFQMRISLGVDFDSQTSQKSSSSNVEKGSVKPFSLEPQEKKIDDLQWDVATQPTPTPNNSGENLRVDVRRDDVDGVKVKPSSPTDIMNASNVIFEDSQWSIATQPAPTPKGSANSVKLDDGHNRDGFQVNLSSPTQIMNTSKGFLEDSQWNVATQPAPTPKDSEESLRFGNGNIKDRYEKGQNSSPHRDNLVKEMLDDSQWNIPTQSAPTPKTSVNNLILCDGRSTKEFQGGVSNSRFPEDCQYEVATQPPPSPLDLNPPSDYSGKNSVKIAGKGVCEGRKTNVVSQDELATQLPPNPYGLNSPRVCIAESSLKIAGKEGKKRSFIEDLHCDSFLDETEEVSLPVFTCEISKNTKEIIYNENILSESEQATQMPPEPTPIRTFHKKNLQKNSVYDLLTQEPPSFAVEEDSTIPCEEMFKKTTNTDFQSKTVIKEEPDSEFASLKSTSSILPQPSLDDDQLKQNIYDTDTEPFLPIPDLPSIKSDIPVPPAEPFPEHNEVEIFEVNHIKEETTVGHLNSRSHQAFELCETATVEKSSTLESQSIIGAQLDFPVASKLSNLNVLDMDIEETSKTELSTCQDMILTPLVKYSTHKIVKKGLGEFETIIEDEISIDSDINKKARKLICDDEDTLDSQESFSSEIISLGKKKRKIIISDDESSLNDPSQEMPDSDLESICFKRKSKKRIILSQDTDSMSSKDSQFKSKETKGKGNQEEESELNFPLKEKPCDKLKPSVDDDHIVFPQATDGSGSISGTSKSLKKSKKENNDNELQVHCGLIKKIKTSKQDLLITNQNDEMSGDNNNLNRRSSRKRIPKTFSGFKIELVTKNENNLKNDTIKAPKPPKTSNKINTKKNSDDQGHLLETFNKENGPSNTINEVTTVFIKQMASCNQNQEDNFSDSEVKAHIVSKDTNNKQEIENTLKNNEFTENLNAETKLPIEKEIHSLAKNVNNYCRLRSNPLPISRSDSSYFNALMENSVNDSLKSAFSEGVNRSPGLFRRKMVKEETSLMARTQPELNNPTSNPLKTSTPSSNRKGDKSNGNPISKSVCESENEISRICSPSSIEPRSREVVQKCEDLTTVLPPLKKQRGRPKNKKKTNKDVLSNDEINEMLPFSIDVNLRAEESVPHSKKEKDKTNKIDILPGSNELKDQNLVDCSVTLLNLGSNLEDLGVKGHSPTKHFLSDNLKLNVESHKDPVVPNKGSNEENTSKTRGRGRKTLKNEISNYQPTSSSTDLGQSRRTRRKLNSDSNKNLTAEQTSDESAADTPSKSVNITKDPSVNTFLNEKVMSNDKYGSNQKDKQEKQDEKKFKKPGRGRPKKDTLVGKLKYMKKDQTDESNDTSESSSASGRDKIDNKPSSSCGNSQATKRRASTKSSQESSFDEDNSSQKDEDQDSNSIKPKRTRSKTECTTPLSQESASKLEKRNFTKTSKKNNESIQNVSKSVENLPGSVDSSIAKRSFNKIKGGKVSLLRSTSFSSNENILNSSFENCTPKRCKVSQVSDSYDSPRNNNKNRSNRELNGCDKVRVMFTGYSDKKLAALVENLGGEMVESCFTCSVLVTDKVKRTVKFLCLLARGRPIVSPKWLLDCRQYNSFIDTKKYILKDSEAERTFSFQLKSSLMKAEIKPLLEGWQVLVTKSVKPPPQEMKNIIECSGGNYLNKRPKSWKNNSIVISCEEDKNLWSELVKSQSGSQPSIVSSEFILTGVLQQTVDIKKYKLM